MVHRDRYMHEVEGFLLAYSVTSRESFEKIPEFYQQILRFKDGNSFSVILIATDGNLENERQVERNGMSLPSPHTTFSLKRLTAACGFFSAVTIQRVKALQISWGANSSRCPLSTTLTCSRCLSPSSVKSTKTKRGGLPLAVPRL
jgi:GTPase SAR1 family protein